MTVWCEHCRDRFAESHYDSEGHHKVGRQYGPTGKDMARLVKAEALAEAQTLRIIELDTALRQCQNTNDVYVYKIVSEVLKLDAASEQERKP